MIEHAIVFATSDVKRRPNVTKCEQVEVTVPDCVSHMLIMLINRQRTIQNHTQDFKFVSRGYCATSNGDSL